MECIVEEAKMLANKGVSEIILIAQDTTSYGLDLYKKPMLAELLKELNKIENLKNIKSEIVFKNIKTVTTCK